MNTRSFAAFGTALLLLGTARVDAAPSLPAGDWRQFRGPLGNGVSADTDLAPKWSGPDAILWKSPLPGRGLSSPIVVGEKVFVTSSSGPKQDRLHVLCFAVSTGELLWERKFWATGRTMCHEKTSVAAPTPVSDGQRIYALYSSNDLLCLDLDGNLIWLRGLTRDYPNASNSLGMSSSPVVADGAVVVQIENDSESFAAGIDPLTGVNRWKKDRPKMANWTSPVVTTMPGSGKPAVVLQSGKGVVWVNPGDGKELATFSGGASTIPSSASADGVLIVPSQGLTALKPVLDGGGTETLWRSAPLRPGTASPMVVGDKVYTLNDAGVLSAGEMATGKRLWQVRLKGPFSGSPIASGQRLIIFNEAGIGQVVDLSGPEGRVEGEIPLGETVLCTASIGSGAVFVRSDGHLWKLKGK